MRQAADRTAHTKRRFSAIEAELGNSRVFEWAVSAVRQASEEARENEDIRQDLREDLAALRAQFKDIDNAAEAYSAMYLDGEKRPSAQEISERLFIDKRTIHRHTRLVMAALALLYFRYLAVPLLDAIAQQSEASG